VLLSLWLLTQNGPAAQSPEALMSVLSRLVKSILYIGYLWIAADGFGRVTARLFFGPKGCPVLPRLGLGMACLLIGQWLIGSLLGVSMLVSWSWGWTIVGAICCLTPVLTKNPWREHPVDRHLTWGWLWLSLPVSMLLVAACCPPGTLWRVEAYGYDVMSYHLQLPRECVEAGAVPGLTHNVYSFLPSLIETGYLLVIQLHGSVQESIYTGQLFHVSLAVYAAMALGRLASHLTTKQAGVGVAALFLAIPWVQITGSLAYNEMGVMAFGAGALLIAFTEPGRTFRGAMAIGFLVGAATLCKLTAGMMIAIPVGLILLLGLNHPPANQSASADKGDATPRSGRIISLKLAAIAALAGLLTLSPYLIRNTVQTGNPVFPFAASTLGQGHWDDELVERWDRGHGLAQNQEGRLDALGRQWLLNTGYGAIGGSPTPRETQNIARFDKEGGVPILWLAVVAAAILVMTHKDTRRYGAALLLMLGIQVGFWLFFTHLQSRFLIPTLLPACLLAGLGYARLQDLTRAKSPSVAPLLGSAVLVSMIAASYITLNAQTRTVSDPDTGKPLQLPIWMALNTDLTQTDHPINRLPEASKTLLVADNAGLLYLDRPFVYASAFDEAPLGRFMRENDHDPRRVNQAMRDGGITHIWVHWSELNRLHSTYGHDPDITPDSLNALIATGWRVVETAERSATLYALPDRAVTTEGAESAE